MMTKSKNVYLGRKRVVDIKIMSTEELLEVNRQLDLRLNKNIEMKKANASDMGLWSALKFINEPVLIAILSTVICSKGLGMPQDLAEKYSLIIGYSTTLADIIIHNCVITSICRYINNKTVKSKKEIENELDERRFLTSNDRPNTNKLILNNENMVYLGRKKVVDVKTLSDNELCEIEGKLEELLHKNEMLREKNKQYSLELIKLVTSSVLFSILTSTICSRGLGFSQDFANGIGSAFGISTAIVDLVIGLIPIQICRYINKQTEVSKERVHKEIYDRNVKRLTLKMGDK